MLTIRPVFGERFTFHTGAGPWRPAPKTPRADLMGGQILLGDTVLALSGLAEDHRYRVGCAPGLDPAREPPRHPHQMRVVQLVVTALVQPSPPSTQPARLIPEWVERVKHDPINAVIGPNHQIRIPQTEFIAGHPPTKPPTPRQVKLPEGPPPRAKSRRRRSLLRPEEVGGLIRGLTVLSWGDGLNAACSGRD